MRQKESLTSGGGFGGGSTVKTGYGLLNEHATVCILKILFLKNYYHLLGTLDVCLVCLGIILFSRV